jgi:endoglucanase
VRAAGFASLAALAGLAGSAGAAERSWPLLRAYTERFVSPEGRVIDHTASEITTSEGQSYALFFALVNDDRALFRRLYAWTRDNLAGGRLGDELPAYKWGRRPGGSWGVLDANSAADSDLWTGYVLVEAGRLWNDAELDRVGRALCARVVAREVRSLPGLGPMLIPAPRGFRHGRTYRLNPSYLPLQVLEGLTRERVPGPWAEIRENAVRLLIARATQGFVDDWVAYRPGDGFTADPVRGPFGSYDAIRVYLWHALLDPQDPAGGRLALDGPLRYWRAHERVPERVAVRHPHSGARPGPVGFLAVLLPRLKREGDASALHRLERQIERARVGGLYGQPPTYYDQNLILFAQGFVEGRYRFDPAGRLVPSWTEVPARPSP